LRERIRFSEGNILEGPLGTARQYDVVFCRNLLIYFDDPTTSAAIDRLSRHLADDGMLLVGHAEVPSAVRHGFVPMPHRQAFALRKVIALPGTTSRPAPPGEAAPPPRRTAAAPTSLRTPGRPSANKAPVSRPPPTAVVADSGETLLEHARKLADAGRQLEAEAACRELLAQQPQSAEAYFILGLLAESAGNQAEAETQLKRCLYLLPDHYEALCHLALLQEQGGNSSAAATLKARAARVFQRQQPPR
jgi:chemotaxis protein methyltransferase WspC